MVRLVASHGFVAWKLQCQIRVILRLVLFNSDSFGHTDGGEPVEDSYTDGRFGFLDFKFSAAHFRTDDGLEAEHGGLGQ